MSLSDENPSDLQYSISGLAQMFWIIMVVETESTLSTRALGRAASARIRSARSDLYRLLA